MEVLAQMLREHMAARGITQQELARRCDMHPTQIKRLLEPEGKRPPEAETLRKVHAGTGIPITVLIVASGMFTAAELGAKVVTTPVDPDSISNEQLLRWVRQRMRDPDSEPDVLSESMEAPVEPATECAGPVESGEPRLRVAPTDK